MRRHRTWSAAFAIVGFGYVLAGMANLVVGAALKADRGQWRAHSALAADILTWVQDSAPLTLIVLAGLLAAGKTFRSSIGDPWAWDAIHGVLNALQVLAFAEDHGRDPPHYHRVTLFRAVGFRWCPAMPWVSKRWLIPYERSGHMTRECRAAFRLSDTPERAEGIAGQTWARNQVIVVTGLPDVSGSPRPAAMREYAAATFVSEQWLKNERPAARTYCGIPVERRGKLWGVLVFDSRAESSIDETLATKQFSRVAAVLAKLLEKASR